MLFKIPESVSFAITALSAALLVAGILTAKRDHIGLANARDAWESHELDVSSGVPLTDLDSPDHLQALRVESSKAEAIGEVRALELGSDGKVRAVVVAAPGWLGLGVKTISVDARDLVYLESRNSLVSRLTKSELVNHPRAGATNNDRSGRKPL